MQQFSKHRFYVMGVLLYLVLFSALQVSRVGYRETENANSIEGPRNKSMKVSDSPITITSNEDFESLGFPGSGTEGDPYRIEDLSIDGNDDYCIQINDTTAWFRVQDCTFHGAWHAIELWNTSNGEVRRNNFTENHVGVVAVDSDNLEIRHNTINNGARGIWYENNEYLRTSHIDYNSITNQSLSGIAFSQTFFQAARYNNISHCSDGILIQWSEYVLILENTITECDTGIWIHSGESNEIRSNYLGHNSDDNAVDDGTDNDWNHTGLGGNYWDDYVSGGIYSIPGDANSVDYAPKPWPLDSPTLDNPDNLTYTRGEDGNSISWSPSDVHPHNYTILRNGTTVLEGGWSGSDITIDVNGLNPGFYNYTLVVRDLGGNTAQDTVFVNVLKDTTNPTISHPDNIQFTEGDNDNIIVWDVNDLNPFEYYLLRNGTEIRYREWDGTSIEYPLTNLDVGVYNFTLTIVDKDSNSASDTVLVTVEYDSDDPDLVSAPADIAYEYGETGNNITWDFIELNPDRYEITRDGTIIEGSQWNGESITFSVDGWDVGSYTLRIEVFDENGNSASDIVTVTVRERPSPVNIDITIGVIALGGGTSILGILCWGIRKITKKDRN
ncbi:MAG: NosD domain-containing protein [Candidatus Thorarchaeota archaeon]